MRRLLLDILVPAVVAIAVLVAVDQARGEASPWWAVALIVAVTYALWDGLRYLARRRS